MKIAFIDAKLNLKSGGGSNQSLHLIASKLVSLGHQVVLITLSPAHNAYPEDLPYPVIAEGTVENLLDRKYGLALRAILRKYENEVDIYHLWGSTFILDGAVYKRLGGRNPVVAYLNNYSFCTKLDLINTECYKRCGVMSQFRHRPENLARKAVLLLPHALEHCLEIRLVNQVDAFIAISPTVAEIYSWRNMDQRKIFVIPPAIDYEYLRSLRQKHIHEPPSNGRYNILYVGRLSAEKGVDILIYAVSRLQFPVTLHIVGDGPQRNDLEQYSRQLGLSDRVVFHDWMPFDTIANCYLSSQLFVHPARWPEPLGRAVLDAMALEVPVVAAEFGGPPWALQGTGLLFRPGDANDLIDKIELMHGNPSLAAELARKAGERAKDFDYNKVMPQLLEVYTSVIEAGNRSSHMPRNRLNCKR